MFNKQLRFAIYNAIKGQGNFLGTYANDQGIMSFLSNIWPLRGMDSEDPRYKNAYDDAFQHLVRNSDWDDDQTYLKRFALIDGDEQYFIKFVELVVHPETRNSAPEIQQYVSEINKLLAQSPEILVVSEYYNGLPIYRFGEKSIAKTRSEIIATNTIPFYKEDVIEKSYPCFVLVRDFWDDYKHSTLFSLEYYPRPAEYTKIGPVKIMKRNTKTTWHVIDQKFVNLGEEYASLGQEKEYYKNFKTFFLNLIKVFYWL